MNCEWTRKVWFGTTLTINFNNIEHDGFNNWLWDTIGQKDGYTVAKVLNTLYYIWWSRNKDIDEERIPRSKNIVEYISNKINKMTQPAKDNTSKEKHKTHNKEYHINIKDL